MKKHYVELGMAVLLLVCFYILSREAVETAGKLADVSGNIKNSQVILIDAGHGGVDSGMVGVNDLKEKGINLEISIKLKAILEKKGFAVVMTREEDRGLYEENTKNMKAQDLQNRIAMIVNFSFCEIFVPVIKHTNFCVERFHFRFLFSCEPVKCNLTSGIKIKFIFWTTSCDCFFSGSFVKRDNLIIFPVDRKSVV